MISGSTSAFIFAMIRAGLPARACSASRSIISRNRWRMFAGATSSLRYSALPRETGERVEQISEVGADRRARM